MKISLNITSPFPKKGYPPERSYYATDLGNLVKIGSSLYREKPYMRFRRNHQDLAVSYQDFDRMIDCTGTAFAELGLSDSPIAVIGETSPEWVITYLATVNGGGLIVPLDKELSTSEIANFLRRAGCRALVYSHSFHDKVLEIEGELPDIVCFAEISNEFFPYPDATGSQTPITDRFIPFEALIRRGTALLNEGSNAFTGHTIDVEKPCACLFTSGTTGTSKGVLLCQKNITSSVNSAFRLTAVTSDDVIVSVLPIHHTYEFSCGILTPYLAGMTVCINESLKTVLRSFQQYKPTILILVPLFVSTIYKKIMETVRKKGMEKKLKLAMSASNKARMIGIDLRKTLFSEITETFGGNLTRIVAGGAPLNPDMCDFFDAIGISLTQGYGITECSPLISVSPFNWIKGKSVGLPVPGLEARIGDGSFAPGEIDEIIVRGDNVMLGYQGDPEATAAVLEEDGWFHTGDLGYIDKDGFIYITGRKKNVIVLHNGKNVFPEEIEEYLEPIELISECVVVGRTAEDGETINVTAVIYPDFDKAAEQALVDLDAISEVLRKEINKINVKLPMFKQIRGIELRKTPFVKTTTKKIIRYRINEE
ncbi:MAG: AMP-binding protein [Clostridia bacterium]|nr:AMP-binding protein [Clostridia bacterium]